MNRTRSSCSPGQNLRGKCAIFLQRSDVLVVSYASQEKAIQLRAQTTQRCSDALRKVLREREAYRTDGAAVALEWARFLCQTRCDYLSLPLGFGVKDRAFAFAMERTDDLQG